MPARVKLGAWMSILIIAAALLGCAVVDQYSGRAIVYNLEAEQAQDQAMLLNIVRAYLRRPMQFTTVSTITGTASAAAGVQYTLPTNVPFRPATQGATGIAAFPPLPTWLFNGSMTGGPAFTVPVLDTQEFYQGILKAIPGQIWDLYLQANYPPDLLFNLFVQRAVIRHKPKGGSCPLDDHTPSCEFTFYNYVAKDIQIKLFQKFADYLLWLGLTTEAPAAKTVPFDHPTNVNIRYVGTPGKPDINNNPTAEVVAPPGGAASGETSAAAKAYKLCFAPRSDISLIGPSSLCGHGAVVEQSRAKLLRERQSREQQLRKLQLSEQQLREQLGERGAASQQLRDLQLRIQKLTEQQQQLPEVGAESGDDTAKSTITTSGLATVNVNANKELVGRLIAIATRYGCPDTAEQAEFAARDDCPDVRGQLKEYFRNERYDMELTVYMRNTEGMIYYLGEVVRRALKPDQEKTAQPTFVKRSSPYGSYPWTYDCEEPSKLCSYVFRLIEGDAPAPGGMASIQYGGLWYSVAGSYDPDEPDLSTLTLEFVKQQIALNSSAKSLPQSSVITTVAP